MLTVTITDEEIGKSLDPMKFNLARLRLTKGDILVVSHPVIQGVYREHIIRMFEDARDGVEGEWGILFLPGGAVSVEKMTDEQLSRLGLCRIQADTPIIAQEK